MSSIFTHTHLVLWNFFSVGKACKPFPNTVFNFYYIQRLTARSPFFFLSDQISSQSCVRGAIISSLFLLHLFCCSVILA